VGYVDSIPSPRTINCYKCKHRRSTPGDCHSSCTSNHAQVQGNEIGIRRGWFMWPYNFDPVWLIACTGYEERNVNRN